MIKSKQTLRHEEWKINIFKRRKRQKKCWIKIINKMILNVAQSWRSDCNKVEFKYTNKLQLAHYHETAICLLKYLGVPKRTFRLFFEKENIRNANICTFQNFMSIAGLKLFQDFPSQSKLVSLGFLGVKGWYEFLIVKSFKKWVHFLG